MNERETTTMQCPGPSPELVRAEQCTLGVMANMRFKQHHFAGRLSIDDIPRMTHHPHFHG